MKFLVLAGFLFAACLQVESRAILHQGDYEMPKILKDTMEQSFSCAMQLGPQKARQIPRMHGLQLLPEDNEPLSELWGCIWKKKGIINENADLDADQLEKYLIDLISIFGEVDDTVKEQAHTMTETCKNEEASNYGLKAVKVQNCINNYIAEKHLRK